MATRKVLINRHTTGNTAPVASEFYHGELAVQHKTGEEILWTKNNDDVMVPFISCAQTISIVSGMIDDAEVTYDVKAKTGEVFLKVESGGTDEAKEFILSTSGVASDEKLKELSGATEEKVELLTNILSALTDVVVTGISGDTIIVAEKVENSTGSNTYNLTHKQAPASVAAGFNKLATDAYGHVTASTAVEAADIENLGFKDSAWTEEKITDAIEALGSVSAETGKYITAIGVNDGELAIEEANLPTLAVESAGTGNVVSKIAVDGHKILYSATSVATSDAIEELSAATIALSAGTIHDIETLSGDVVEYVKVVSGNIETVINELSGAVINNETNITTVSGDVIDLSAVTLTGVSLNDTPLTVTNHVVSVPVTSSGSGIASASESGSVADAKAVKEYVQDVLSSSVDYKGATNDVPSGTPDKGDLWIASSAFTVDGKNVEVGDFIIYNGSSWDVIEKNLDGAITGNLTPGTVVLAETTNSVESLNNGTNGQVLEMVDGAPAWANLPVLSSATTGTGNVVTSILVNDHEITYAKDFTAASDADIRALSGVVEDFSGATDAKFIELSAYTKDVDDKVKALSAGTIQLSGDIVTYVDEQIDEVYGSAVTYTNEKVAAEIALLDSVGSASTTGHYLTSVTITDGKISAVGEVAVPAAVPVTAVDGNTGNTAAAVLSEIVTGGTDGHQLTLNKTNMVFSAMTSQSADVATNAAHASAATKVDSALTMTDGTNTQTYDGSAARSLTFGTTGDAGLKSMSMTSAGVVDVEVIDCGTY